jgi:hypothetical protein
LPEENKKEIIGIEEKRSLKKEKGKILLGKKFIESKYYIEVNK